MIKLAQNENTPPKTTILITSEPTARTVTRHAPRQQQTLHRKSASPQSFYRFPVRAPGHYRPTCSALQPSVPPGCYSHRASPNGVDSEPVSPSRKVYLAGTYFRQSRRVLIGGKKNPRRHEVDLVVVAVVAVVVSGREWALCRYPRVPETRYGGAGQGLRGSRQICLS